MTPETNSISAQTSMRAQSDYIGTIIGESTSREFRIAVAHESVREQDIVAVDVKLRASNGKSEHEEMRLWAKVQNIERLNPLFPAESGHELAETRTSAFDTVLSLSREMVTAVCQVLGAEFENNGKGELNPVRYPPQPATQVYKPKVKDLTRVVVGSIANQSRALQIASLANRDDVKVAVDGHAIVTRHLAILAMTGAGKSWTARRVVEELAERNYPVVIFDPHGDYAGLGKVPSLQSKVQRYYAHLPVFEEEADNVISIIESLTSKIAETPKLHFANLFQGAIEFINVKSQELAQRTTWLSQHLANPKIAQFGIKKNLFFLADFIQAVIQAAKTDDIVAFGQINDYTGTNYQGTIDKRIAGYIQGLPGRLRGAATEIMRMEKISHERAGDAQPLPINRTELVKYGQISVISLAGYSESIRAAIYTLVAREIFDSKVQKKLIYPVSFILEEAHNFAPGRANSPAEERAVAITKQIAQEGRKFRIGLTLISQRPSRIDETTLAMCNSFIIMRMMNPGDQAYIRRVVESLGEDEARMLPNLRNGEAILAGQLTNFPILVKITAPESQGEREEEDVFAELAALQG